MARPKIKSYFFLDLGTHCKIVAIPGLKNANFYRHMREWVDKGLAGQLFIQFFLFIITFFATFYL